MGWFNRFHKVTSLKYLCRENELIVSIENEIVETDLYLVFLPTVYTVDVRGVNPLSFVFEFQSAGARTGRRAIAGLAQSAVKIMGPR